LGFPAFTARVFFGRDMDILTSDDQLRVGKASSDILKIARELQKECSPCNPDRRRLQFLAAYLMDNASQIMCIAVKD
jgi:hypothetical protein